MPVTNFVVASKAAVFIIGGDVHLGCVLKIGIFKYVILPFFCGRLFT